ncbi:MAG: protein translocase subunit SecD [Ruminiclostridium sp.]|nr:protein translocase subunit SecD [Ruminiclostridium sp.]
MKRVSKPVFFVVLLLILAFAGVVFFGIHTQYGDFTYPVIRGVGDIRWGIDIRGGVDVSFTSPEDYDASDTELDAAKSIVETRLVANNITDYELYVDYGNDKIIVRFPWQADDEEFDPEEAVKELGATALLTFREGKDGSWEEGGSYEDLPLIISGSDVESASARYSVKSGGTNEYEYMVALKLKDSGKQKFAEATEKLAKDKGYISVYMDGEAISVALVNEKITDGEAVISGSFTAEEVQELANKINGGALPFKLETASFSTISPTLGTGARDAMALAGIIAFAFIAVFMISFYRLPGVVAVIGLIGQVAGTFAAISGFFPFANSLTLTIPGIAGIILAVGMGVDANVIVGERIKEEIGAGKTVNGAIATGYKRAFTAVFDGNVTMIIVAIILMGAFGTPDSLAAMILKPVFFMFGASTEGTIYSFGYTLMVGVILNFLFGIFAARLMTSSLANFKIFRNPALYGGKSAKKIAAEKAAKEGGAV